MGGVVWCGCVWATRGVTLTLAGSFLSAAVDRVMAVAWSWRFNAHCARRREEGTRETDGHGGGATRVL